MSKPSITTDDFLAGAKWRRSVYGLKSTSSVPDSRVEDILKEVISFSPSSYNSQPGRITLVVGEKHKQLWDVVIAAAKPILEPIPGVWAAMGPQFDAFKGAYGSVLFWDSGEAIKEAQETHKSAAHMFPQFADHASGMAQILVWSALELEGLGANLQHMGAIPPAEEAIKKFVGVPADWSLKAHLNYGDLAQPQPEVPGKKPISEILTVLK